MPGPSRSSTLTLLIQEPSEVGLRSKDTKSVTRDPGFKTKLSTLEIEKRSLNSSTLRREGVNMKKGKQEN